MEDAPSSISSSPSRIQSLDHTHESLGYHRRSHPTSVLPASPSGFNTRYREAEGAEVETKDESNLQTRITHTSLESGLSKYFNANVWNPDETMSTNIASEDDPRAHDDAGTTRILGEIPALRGSIPHSQSEYVRAPPMGVKYQRYHEFLDETSAVSESQKYTQLLIWCLRRRIDHLELKKGHSQGPSSKNLQTLEALKSVESALCNGRVQINWEARDTNVKSSDATLKRPSENPENTINAKRLALAAEALDRIQDVSKDWLQSLKISEQSVEQAIFSISNTPNTSGLDINSQSRDESGPHKISPSKTLRITVDRIRQELYHLDSISTEGEASLAEAMSANSEANARSLLLLNHQSSWS